MTNSRRIPPPPADLVKTPCRDCGSTKAGPLDSRHVCQPCADIGQTPPGYADDLATISGVRL